MAQLSSIFGVATKAGDTMSGNLNMADNEIIRPKIKDYALIHNALGNKSGATTIDLELGNYVSITQTAAITLTFSNPPPDNTACAITLELTNGGNYTVTWPLSVVWGEGNVPTLTTNGIDVLMFITRNGGVTWFGLVSMMDSK